MDDAKNDFESKWLEIEILLSKKERKKEGKKDRIQSQRDIPALVLNQHEIRERNSTLHHHLVFPLFFSQIFLGAFFLLPSSFRFCARFVQSAPRVARFETLVENLARQYVSFEKTKTKKEERGKLFLKSLSLTLSLSHSFILSFSLSHLNFFLLKFSLDHLSFLHLNPLISYCPVSFSSIFREKNDFVMLRCVYDFILFRKHVE